MWGKTMKNSPKLARLGKNAEIVKAYTKEAKFYDEQRFGSKVNNYCSQVETRKMLKYLKPKKVLELGAGTGRYAALLAGLGFDYTRIDITPAMLNVAKRKIRNLKLRARFVQMDAHELDFDEGTFDSVFCDRVFKLMENPIKVLRGVHRVLKADGRVIVNVEAKCFLESLPITSLIHKVDLYIVSGERFLKPNLNLYQLDIKKYSKKDIASMFEKAGFAVKETERIFNFPLFFIRLAPSWIIKKLLQFDVSTKRGLIGSKLMVMGEKRPAND